MVQRHRVCINAVWPIDSCLFHNWNSCINVKFEPEEVHKDKGIVFLCVFIF